jgi:crossover junction endodeoxyribonuclease RuvC
MTILIGIDPGSRITGYGVIRAEGSRFNYIASGCIRIQGDIISERLKQIFSELQTILQTYQPVEAAIEQVFMHQNAGSALKLGQARGVAIASLAMTDITVAEYSARQIKQAVVGQGAAKKEQVQHMVRLLLNLTGTPQVDAADALAVALCHAQSRRNLNIIRNQQTVPARGRFRRGRMR